MRIRLGLLVGPALIAALGTSIAATTSVTREFDVDAIRMTYEELSAIVANVKGLVEKANSGATGHREDVSLSISAGEDSVNIQGWGSLSAVRDLPKVGYSVRLRYRYYGAPVSQLDLTLTDWSRKVTLEGSDATQINAISSYLREQLSSQTVYFGGSRFRWIGGVILWASWNDFGQRQQFC